MGGEEVDESISSLVHLCNSQHSLPSLIGDFLIVAKAYKISTMHG